MVYFKDIEKSIEKFADLLADELEQRKFFDKKEFFSYAKIRLHFAISEILKLEENDLIKQRNGLTELYRSPDTPNWRKVKLQSQIADLNLKIKERNVINNSFEDSDEYNQLKQYIRTKIGDAPLRDFFENWLKKGDITQTGKRKIKA